MFQRPLLTGERNTWPSPSTHEFEAEQEGDGGQHERWHPQIAPEPAVQETGGDESTSLARVVEALHPDEPRPIVIGRDVNRLGQVGSLRAGTHQYLAYPYAGHALKVNRGMHHHTELGERGDQLIVLLRLRQDHHDLRLGPGGEGREGRGQVAVEGKDLGRARCPGAPGGHQLAADHDDAGALPFGQRLGDVATRRQRARRRWGGEQEVAHHHDPPVRGRRRPTPRHRAVSPVHRWSSTAASRVMQRPSCHQRGVEVRQRAHAGPVVGRAPAR